jgi:hypothetical protein
MKDKKDELCYCIIDVCIMLKEGREVHSRISSISSVASLLKMIAADIASGERDRRALSRCPQRHQTHRRSLKPLPDDLSNPTRCDPSPKDL